MEKSDHESNDDEPLPPKAVKGKDRPLSFHWRAIHDDFIRGLDLPPCTV